MPSRDTGSSHERTSVDVDADAAVDRTDDPPADAGGANGDSEETNPSSSRETGRDAAPSSVEVSHPRISSGSE
ncbi:hypothetical protein [Haladaptatus sp. NG-WS-4]